jgi:heptosyltransferase-2
LRKLKDIHPKSRITWVTDFPILVPRAFVENVLKFKSPDLLIPLAGEFDLLYSLDKDHGSVSLASLVKAKGKKGYVLKRNRPAPIDKGAEHKYLTGLFDDVNIKNRKHYVEEIFEICGFKFNGEKYILELPQTKPNLPVLNGPVVGLNTGCGSRWSARLWPEEYWIKLARLLKEKGYTPLLLGGPQENELNSRISKKGNALYLGTFNLGDFLHVVNLCDLVITQVTMALHIAIGLNKKVILMNNVFNRHEFYLYGLGKIVEPAKKCLGCYKNECSEDCMSLISPEQIMQAVEGSFR